MSPSRTRKPVILARPWSEVVTAVCVGVGIVAATVLLIWLMRPGTPGVGGTGGLLSRQPRVTLLVILTVLVGAAALYWVRRGHRRPKRLAGTGGVIGVSVVVVVGAVLAGIFWPSGLVHHWPPQFKPPKPTKSSTSTTFALPSTTAPKTSTTRGTSASTSTTPPTTAKK